MTAAKPAAKTISIPPGDAALFRSQIDEMNAMFADEDRADWFDADDIAREIALQGSFSCKRWRYIDSSLLVHPLMYRIRASSVYLCYVQ